MIAAVRIRGPVDVDQPTEDTMKNLGLEKRNQLVLLEETDSILGMLDKAKDFIAYGDVSEEVVEQLEDEKGVDAEAGTSFSMRSPKKGYRDTRKQYGQGGSLGKRDSMDDLVRRML